MSVVKKISVVVMSSLWLTSCSSFYGSNGDENYLKSRNGPELVIPPSSGLTTVNLGYFYNLPQQNQDARVSIKPPTA